MRTCLVSPYELSLEGGVNKHVFYLAKSLRDMGDEVEIIGPASGNGRPAGPEVQGVTTFGGVVSIQGNESDNRIGLLTSPLAVRDYMRSRSFDVIHIHEPYVPSLPYYALWLTNAKARVCTFHRYSEHEAPLTRIVRQVLSPHLWWFQRGIAVSAAAARYAQVAWARPLSIIPNGVDTKFFTPSHHSRSEAGPVRLLFVGQWTDKRKGLPVLLEAVARLRERKVDVHLDVVGQGDPRIPVPEGLHWATFHGRVSEAALRQRFRECDIFVAPSTGQESFGIVLVEAMAVGRPVVCSDIDGYREVVTPEGAELSAPREAGELADVLQALCRDPQRRRGMGHHNRVESLKYDWATLAGQIREEYEMALRAPAPTRSLLGRRWTIYRATGQTAASAETAPVQVEPVEARMATANAKR